MRAIGTTVPSAVMFVKALRIGAALGRAAARGWITPPVAMAAVEDALVEDDEIWAYKTVLETRDHLKEALVRGDGAVEAWEASPGRGAGERWLVLMAALVARDFDEVGATPPEWTACPPLPREWLLESPLLAPDEVRRTTPAWLAARGIFVSGRDLVTV